MTVAPTEWAILNCANGDRSLRAISEQAKMPISQVVSVTTALIERGLIRMGLARRLPWWIARGCAANPAEVDRVDSCRGGGCAGQDERTNGQRC